MGKWMGRGGRRMRTYLEALWPLLFIVNCLGFLYGLAWYGDDLWHRPAPLWPWTADCPWSALLFAAAVMGWRLHLRLPVLYTFAKGYAVYFGFWTLFVLALIRSSDLVLYTAHLGLLSEGLIFWRIWPHDRSQANWLVLALAVNLVLDYGFGTHPRLPPGDLTHVFWFSLIWLAIFCWFFWFFSGVKQERQGT